jgi:hypothetical protein
LRGDPTEITATGHLLGFAILPAIVTARPEEYYPVGPGPKRSLRLSNRNLGTLILRAWQATNATGEMRSHLHLATSGRSDDDYVRRLRTGGLRFRITRGKPETL